ncbi:mannonate dehydratase [Marinoscillum sp. MHG1-6]|uniref:mannonate dehydratase n=1 Tax=Marinoscillum sp. MHG1-6 TaxID=2959627 RepID=UPI0021587847|nr:mannonate dehydratase [Marinoscillum sp. MHG1-6]
MRLEKSWRWFGEKDPVSLQGIRQMGVTGVVTSLYHVPAGAAWDANEINDLKNRIASHGLKWNVVESLPVEEGIKTHSKEYDRLIENYIGSLKALSENGIYTICYNFMPVLDWARTDLSYRLPNGGTSMKFDYAVFAAFDLFILQRPNAEKDYDQKTLLSAEEVIQKLSKKQQNELAFNIIVATQSFIHGSVSDPNNFCGQFLQLLERYSDINEDQLRLNLKCFLDDILPYAEKYGVKMAIHPDDPPFSLLGLPRIASTSDDFEWIFEANKSNSNGLTLCSGSLSVGDEDVCEIASRFSEKIYFAHLRNNEVAGYRVFYESGHLEGRVDMIKLLRILLDEQARRSQVGVDYAIPVRPDHGIAILQDEILGHNPGYPLYGRFRGLMELSGAERAILELKV